MILTKTTLPARWSFARNCLACAGIGAFVASSGCSSGSGSAAPPANYQVGGTISGLPSEASGLVLADDGATLAVKGGATGFSFTTTLAAGSAYAVTVQTSPSGLTCTVAGGSGTLNSNISNIVVTCADKAYSLGGTISGLGSASGLVLENGSNTLSVPANTTTFKMSASVPYTASYQVTVKTQPTGAGCAVTPSTPATMPSDNVTSVKVACTDKPYTLGGKVSISAPTGVILSDQGLVITNTSNGDRFTFTANATSFTMPKPVDFGASFSLSVSTQPTLLTCAVNHPSAVMPAANVSLTISCSDRAFSLSGTVTINAPSGAIVSDHDLVLTNSGNGDTYTFAANATSFTMPKSVPYGSPYAVSVTTQPAGLFCSASNPSATMPAGNVTAVAVTCADQSYTLGGSVGGLGSASGLELANNGADQTTILANAMSFNMNTSVPYGAAYDVTVVGHPSGIGCAVSGGSGIMPGDALMSVVVTCTPNTFSSPMEVVLDAAGNLYVADEGDNAVQKILSTSGVEAAIGSGFSAPKGVGIDASGNLYIADTDHNAVKEIVKATGSVLALGSGFSAPAAVAVDASGNVYVADTGNQQVEEISSGSSSQLASGYAPSGIAVDANSNVYVADATHDAVREILASGGGATLGHGFNDPRGLAVDSIGNVYVADAGNDAVKEISASGNTFPLGSGFSMPSGVGLDADGNVWVADTGNDVITEIPNPNLITGVESVLYSFAVSPDGANPYGSLMQASDGNFYGMTYNGGANGNGSVIKVTPAGVETVLYSFGTSGDGIEPSGNLIQASDGNLYGMTYAGGANNTGTIIKVTPAGTESVLYSFAASGSGDGANPNGSLIQANDGNLYGMTLEGGANGTGAVIEITTAGTESVLYSFAANGSGDGASPWDSLIQASNGVLYGMTYAGGTNGSGAVISITLGGTESVLYSLGASGDGANPYGNLIQASDGNFYGVTRAGGANGNGTVIKITPAGTESVLYSFGSPASYPNGSLIQASDGNFYGMTLGGGVNALGDVFRVTAAGVQSVVYSFGGSGDGEVSYGSLIQANGGTFYAITTYGGANNKGAVVAVH